MNINHNKLTEKQHHEIGVARAQVRETRRPTNAAMEDMLFHPFNVLDYGFVRLIDYMGDESAIVQAARVSYGTGTKKASEDTALIRYLLRHRHTTPLEMCEIKLHIKLPIFVARQWIRHRTANVNEYSGRYSILDKEFYVPEPAALATQSQTNKQGRGDILAEHEADAVMKLLRDDANRAYEHYELMLGEKRISKEELEECPNLATPMLHPEYDGLARELARIGLSLNFYTQWYWKVDVHNLINFLSLREDKHAQYEVRVYAEIMSQMLKSWMPNVHAAFLDYRLNAFNLSATQLSVLRDLLVSSDIKRISDEVGISARETNELLAALKLP